MKFEISVENDGIKEGGRLVGTGLFKPFPVLPMIISDCSLYLEAMKLKVEMRLSEKVELERFDSSQNERLVAIHSKLIMLNISVL